MSESPGRVPASTPVYNGFIWTITALPAFAVLGFLAFDFKGYVAKTIELTGEAPTSGVPPVALLDPAYLWLIVLGWALAGLHILLSYFDWRTLRRNGVERPFHWAWSFLGNSIYLIGRSIVVYLRSGRGLAPIWVTIGLILVSLVVVSVKVTDALGAMNQ